jgi:thiamine biosynthesis lipoprotein
MASLAEVRLHAADQHAAEHAFAAIQSEVERIEAKYSRYRDDSVVSIINRAAGGTALTVDDETRALLDYADACWRQSDGLFDITSGVLRTVWDFRNAVVPEQADVERVLARVGWNRVSREGNTIALEREMQIDFGGIGKEYAADRAMAVARDAGIRHGFVNLGGDIRIIGAQSDGRPWRVGIVDPRDPQSAIAQVELGEGGLATSGDYERFFERGGRRYCHILNPKTGFPPDDAPQSVSVVAPLCTIAGSCATIAMLHGDAAANYLRKQGFPYLIVDSRGRTHGTIGA